MPIKSKEGARNALRTAHECSFMTQNMKFIPSLSSFAHELEYMRDDVYNFHVGDGFNHFSDWIRDVFGDDKLARDIFSASRDKAKKLVDKRLEWLEKKAR